MYELLNITKEYPDVRALDDVSFCIEDKESVSIRGESGCGKTTLLKVLAGLIRPDKGEILKDKMSLPESLNKRGIAMVFQDSLLFNNMTVRENILFGSPYKDKERRDKCVNELSAAYGIEDLLDRYPHRISGGQARRVAIARALACERELLLLDEPFTNLDKDLKDRVIKKTKELCKGRCAVLLVSHNEAEANELCDRHLFMEEGRIV